MQGLPGRQRVNSCFTLAQLNEQFRFEHVSGSGQSLPFDFNRSIRTIQGSHSSSSNSESMPNLYFCSSINRGPGILRAVLSWEESKSLLNHHSAHYIGERFPDLSTQLGGTRDFALLRIFDEEADEEWRAGFYHFDVDIMDIDQALQGHAKEHRAPALWR